MGRTNWGVVCFTERLNNRRMWEEYADHMRGAVVEFDLTGVRIPEMTFFKVRYSEERGGASLVDVLASREEGEFSEVLTYKPPKWAHEEEWRLLANLEELKENHPYLIREINVKHGGVVVGLKLPISRVILGPTLTADDKNQIVNAMVYNGKPKLAELAPGSSSDTFILHDIFTGSKQITLV